MYNIISAIRIRHETFEEESSRLHSTSYYFMHIKLTKGKVGVDDV